MEFLLVPLSNQKTDFLKGNHQWDRSFSSSFSGSVISVLIPYGTSKSKLLEPDSFSGGERSAALARSFRLEVMDVPRAVSGAYLALRKVQLENPTSKGKTWCSVLESLKKISRKSPPPPGAMNPHSNQYNHIQNQP